MLSELKMQLIKNNRVITSKKDVNKIMLIDPEGMKFILVKKGINDGKQLYVPITVLAPYMKFQ